MSALANALSVLMRLFIDDGSLAIAILAVVILSGGMAMLDPGQPLVAGIFLLGGCLAVLAANVMRAGQRAASR
jgi:hypothetical protein